MKLSGVPEKAYNSRPSQFGGFWLCACIRAIPTLERLPLPASMQTICALRTDVLYMYIRMYYNCMCYIS